MRPANPLLGDSSLVFYPFLVEARRAILSGRFPLWTPSIYGGHPFFASYQSALLSPFTAIAYILPLPQATTVIAAARLAVGSVGMWVFLRALGLGNAAVMFGGLAYLLNPFSYVWLEHPLSAVAAWMPWLLYGVRRAVVGARGRDVGVLASVTTLVLLAGHPETAFKALLFACGFGAFEAVRTRRFTRAALGLAGAVLLGGLVAAVQIVPFVEYLRESRVLAVRGTSSQLVNPPQVFITAFVPDFYGNPRSGRYLRSDTNYCEQVGYPSVVVWVLAAVSLTSQKTRASAMLFGGVTLLASLIMYGTPLTAIAGRIMPPLRIAAVSRFGIVTITSVIVMAACGLDALMASRPDAARWRRFAPAVAATTCAAVIGALVFAWLVFDRATLTQGRHLLKTQDAAWITTWFLVASVAVVWLIGSLPRRLTSIVLTSLMAADLLLFADGFHPLMRRDLVFPPLPEVETVRRDGGVYRVAGWYQTLVPNVSLVYGLQDFRGYDGVGVNSYLEFLDLGFKDLGSTHALVHFFTPHLIDLLNIKYLLVPADVGLPEGHFTPVGDGPIRVFRNDRVQDRAFLVDQAIVLNGTEARRAVRAGTHDLRRVVVLDREPVAGEEPDRADRDDDPPAIVKYEAEHVQVATRTSGRRFLVLSDVFYPGWTATVDGRRTTIYRADLTFRAVSVPAGLHLVEFSYEPSSFRWGLAISICGIVVLMLMIVRRPSRVA